MSPHRTLRGHKNKNTISIVVYEIFDDYKHLPQDVVSLNKAHCVAAKQTVSSDSHIRTWLTHYFFFVIAISIILNCFGDNSAMHYMEHLRSFSL